jgi:hypothetical protein
MSSITYAGEKQKSSVQIDKAIWKEIRLQAIREDKEIGELIESIFIEKYMRPQTQVQSQPQSQSQLRQPPSELKIIEINLPGIKFSANKFEIIKLAEEANRPDRVDYLTYISNKKYNSKSELNNELLKDIKNKNVEFRINTEPLRKEQYKEKILEQERQPIIK